MYIVRKLTRLKIFIIALFRIKSKEITLTFVSRRVGKACNMDLMNAYLIIQSSKFRSPINAMLRVRRQTKACAA